MAKTAAKTAAPVTARNEVTAAKPGCKPGAGKPKPKAKSAK